MNHRRFVAAAAATLALIAGAPKNALAHSDDGIIAIVAETTGEGLAVTYEIELLYANDDDPADGATVTAAADGPDGAAAGPTPLTATGEPGRYTGTITYPTTGAWELRISSLSPIATLTATIAVADTAPTAPEMSPAAPPATSAAPSTSPAATTTTSTASAAPESAITTQPTPAAPSTAVAGTLSDGGSGISTATIVAIVAGVAVVATGAAFVIARRRP